MLLSWQANSWAADNQTTATVEKIFINADHMQLNIEQGNSVYTGNVKIAQGEMALSGEKIILEQNNNEIERITVTGKPARYRNVTEKGDSIEAESEHMVYIANQNQLVMTVNAQLRQSDHTVSSQKIIYDTLKKIVIAGNRSDTSSADGGSDEKQRVNITLTPKKETSP